MDLEAGRQRVVEAGRQFFGLAFEILAGELRERVEEAVVKRAYLGPDHGRGVPGAVSAGCCLDIPDSSGRVRERTFIYTPKKFDLLVESLEQNPSFAAFDIFTWRTRPQLGGLVPGDPRIAISWERNVTKWADPLPNWVLLYVHGSFDLLLGSKERQAAALHFLRAIGEVSNPACGEISYAVPERVYGAPLEYLLWRERSERESISESRTTIRSYSWVTVISEEVAQRLGGERALVDSGAFFRVERFPGGGCLLQATERFEDYRHDEAYRVFRVLAPALPSGVPLPPKAYPPSINKQGDPDFMIIQADPSSGLD